MRLKPRMILGAFDESDRPLSWRKFAGSSTAWLVALLGLLWFLTYQYCRFAYSHDPTSYFFDQAHGYERRYSLHREQQAYNFIRAANNTSTRPIPTQIGHLMCIGIATVGRTSAQQYVRGTIGSLLQGLAEEERQSIYLMPFIAHTNPFDHPIYREPWLAAVSNRVLEYDLGDDDRAKLQQLEGGHHFRNKSMYDYGYLLEKCHETGATWIAMLEDDVLAREGWYAEATDALTRLRRTDSDDGWLYLRMFYIEGLLGWNSEEWVRYLGWSVFSFLVLAAILYGARIKIKRLQRPLSNPAVLGVYFAALPAFIILYFMAGRVSMQPWAAGVHRMDRFGCCSQGFIFPRAIVPRLIQRTKKAMDEDYYVDMLLERWADAEGLKRFVVVPSLLQHVGAKSSKGWGYDRNAGTTWNFGFESHCSL
ncbi:MAG: hypothetical protein L6R40_008284 [Gallowayella cf. fulva]|nr:MAG: hypothetical protein L6R40_008284 [Xanthomendoza cf. fulva]